MGGANQRGDALTKTTHRADGSFDRSLTSSSLSRCRVAFRDAGRSRDCSLRGGDHHMCGIFGYVGNQRDAAGIVLRGLKKLEYRGYDSWGVAVADGRRVAVEK